MPPRRAAAAKAALPLPPAKALALSGAKITISGSQRGYKQADLKAMIEDLGGEAFISIFYSDHTHLLTSPAEYKSNNNFIHMARDAGVPMVNLKWLLESKAQDARQPEAPYLYEQPKRDPSKIVPMSSSVLPPTPPSSMPAPAAAPVAVAAAPATAAPVPAKGRRKRTATTTAAPAVAPTQADPKRQKTADTQVKKINVPVDDFCNVANAVVHIGDDGTVYDASLNQTNAGNNNNKFYRIQILRQSNGQFTTWTRWGRVGERGQSASLGSHPFASALRDFESKFRNKSGLKWENRNDDPKPSKYAYIERSYEDDDDDDNDNDDTSDKTGAGGEEEEGEQKPVECTLLPPVQKLMELIFNKRLFAATMTSFNYDANKLPLGKLSKTTISRGFQTLKDLSALFDDPSTAMAAHGCPYDAAVERLSNLFYSVIPHAFGRNRPPILSTFAMLKKEIELLESLSDMKDAELLMKAERGKSTESTTLHPADKHYSGLNMEEMTPLDHTSTEYTELASYLTDTRGSTHHMSYQIEDIFRIERQGEKDRFNKCLLDGGKVKTDTRLLWHGSRVTNFGGILGQGLRIAPPEAPATGYMFGKGIYLADMSSKSAGYCNSYISNGTGLLLLCEAKLGSPMQELNNAEYNAGDMAKDKGLYTTLGKGRTGPLKWKDAGVVNKDLAGVQIPDVSTPPGATDVAQACLLYNEYIVYDVSQVRLRYLFRVKMQ